MDLKLSKRRCLVTGAGTGLGRATALALALEGASVIVTGRRQHLLDEVAQAILSKGGSEPRVVVADLAGKGGTARLAEAVGDIDVLVNNAGGSRPITAEVPEGVWEESFALNFTAVRLLTEALLPGMRARKFGRVINVTGAIAQRSTNAASPAKAAVQSWSRGLAGDVAKDGVTVNCIAPGRFDTEQIRLKLHPTARSRNDFIAANIPMGRFGEPEELAALVVFLASPLAGYISGVSIPVDGAMHRLSM